MNPDVVAVLCNGFRVIWGKLRLLWVAVYTTGTMNPPGRDRDGALGIDAPGLNSG
jgi:hypothetical protein